MSDADINHFSVLMEQQDIAELKQDVSVIKAAVKATNRDLAEHKSLPAHVAHGRA